MKRKLSQKRVSKISSSLLLILSLVWTSLSCAAQQQPRISEMSKVSENWAIEFSGVSGRFQQNFERYRINSDGQATFQDDIGPFAGKPGSRKLGSKNMPAESVAEIGKLIEQLDLANAKTRLEKKDNRCQPSLHAGRSYFTLTTGEKTYNFTFCIGYENPIVLNAEQQRILEQIKEKVRAQ